MAQAPTLLKCSTHLVRHGLDDLSEGDIWRQLLANGAEAMLQHRHRENRSRCQQ